MFTEGVDHSEGVCVGRSGAVYCGGEAGQLYRIDDGTPVEVANTGGFLAGVASDAHDFIYACDFGKACVWKIDPRDGQSRVFCDALGERAVRAPNWGAFDGSGNYYFSDSGGFGTSDGCVGIVRPDGTSAIWTEAANRFPNGLAVAPDGSALYVIESNPFPRICRFAINPDGSSGTREVMIEFAATEWPDGMAIAADGRLVISCYRPDRIYLWEEGGTLDVLAEDPLAVILAAPTNVAFHGPDMDRLLATNLGRWHLTDIPAGFKGTPLFYPDLGEAL
jgi:gluconolactonase